MSNETEWSDDNEDLDVPEQPDRDFPISDEESESEDEEYRRFILQKPINSESIDYSNCKKKSPTQKKRKEKIPKQKILFSSPNEPEKEKKNTWVSKRMEQRKINDGKVQTSKRRFNPRLPPPKTKEKNIKKNIDNSYCINDQDFPDLS